MTSIYPSTTSSNTSSSTSSANLLRISGMSSGIDTDSVVKSMVSNYQAKIDKANQDKQTLQWKQEAYRDIIKGIKGLQDYFDPLSSKNIMSGNSLNINTATSDKPSVVSATADSTAKAGTYAVTVTQLATQAKIESATPVSSLVAVNSLADWTNSSNKLTFDLNNGTKVDLTNISTGINSPLTGANTQELVDSINSQIASSALNGKISASYVKEGTTEYVKFTQDSSNNDKIKLVSSENTGIKDIKDISINSGISSSMKLSDLSASNISFKLSYDAATTTTPIQITATSTDTLQSLMDQVNSKTSGAVTMSIDDTTGKILFQTKSSGSTSGLTIADAGNLSALGIDTKAGSAVASGKDALVSITGPGGSQVTTTQSSNKFTTNGVTYNLVAEGSTGNVTVTSNVDTVVANVKSFINDYNTIISTINTKLTEKKDSDYKPLTDAQKQTMSESQITAWETKAKVGILKDDDYLSNLMTQLRGTFAPVYSSYSSANSNTNTKISLSFGNYGTGSIGIDTSSDYTDGGKIVIKDETKLKDAITNNLGDFKKLFIGSSSAPSLDTNQTYIGSKNYNEDGIFKRMDTILRDYVASPGLGKDGTYTLAGSMNIFVNKQYDYSSSGSSGKNTLPDQVYGKTVSINKFQTQLSDAQTRYYAKFTALETAMSKLNSQQSQLSSMLGNA